VASLERWTKEIYYSVEKARHAGAAGASEA